MNLKEAKVGLIMHDYNRDGKVDRRDYYDSIGGAYYFAPDEIRVRHERGERGGRDGDLSRWELLTISILRWSFYLLIAYFLFW